MRILIKGVDKTADRWTQDGALGDSQLIFCEYNLGIYKDLQTALDYLYTNYGVPNDLDSWVAFETGRITTNQIQDAEGNPNANGSYLADYNVYLEFIQDSHEPTVQELMQLGLKEY